MKTHCQNPLCQNRAVKEVRVSVEKPYDEIRALCDACEEAYTWGVQHGRATSEDSHPFLLSQIGDCGAVEKVQQ